MAQFKFLGAMFSADLDSYTGGKIMKSKMNQRFCPILLLGNGL